MPIQQIRRMLHGVADRVDALSLRHWATAALRDADALHGADRELLASEWQSIDADLRLRVLRRTIVGTRLEWFGFRLLIGLEIFVLILLSYTGGRMTFQAEAEHPGFVAILIAVLVGAAVSVVASSLLLRPQAQWFLSGEPADARRREMVARIPSRQVMADLVGWIAGFVCYVLVADVSATFLAVAAGAFILSATTSCSLSYLFAESAARPMSVLAMQGTSEPVVVHGVRERMLVVWLVSSAVPMVGLLAINVGRQFQWLPPVAGLVDWVSVVLALVALISGLIVVMLVGRSIADPLTEMRRVVEAAGAGELSGRVAVYDSSELGVLQSGLNSMLDGLAERERIRALFSKHVGDRVAELAISGIDEMTGANTEVAVIFVDLTGSTSFATQRDPQETAAVLNVFFSVVARVVQTYDGLINKFEGDAALIVFGAPTPHDDPAGAALAAARELAAALGETVPLEWGMGIGYGTVFAGNIGAASRYEYTVIGDSVNEAARLSDRAKESVAPVCASGDAIAAASAAEAEHWRPVERIRLRGRAEETEIYVPATMAHRPEPPTLGSVLGNLMNLGRNR
ncbi:MAG: adenylate/guanylate cyclase domain-containing protein [Gordonia sp. (in: high G+C Gram-positive bacteria)]|uniref:adenylate/guanylate cyclase domain-containing protein n=1 Tax=Gordonia sp. (in: high G+C Gram-positive bacteria) TaxID=84139 RepID=UPI003BB6F966